MVSHKRAITSKTTQKSTIKVIQPKKTQAYTKFTIKDLHQENQKTLQHDVMLLMNTILHYI